MSAFAGYVLVTPARNEAEFIEATLQSVMAQTCRPLKWVIASDGSTDGTDEIVMRYAAREAWIELVRMPPRAGRDFAGKVGAFNAGYRHVRSLPYAAIGCLDGDLSFDADYFAFLLGRLLADPKLGVVGTPFRESSGSTYDYRFVSVEHVSGACQLFRRECFEEIGGYMPVRGGGIDYIAVTTARMKGWKTRTFTEKVSVHHRKMGTAQHGLLRAKFRTGVKDYALGNHPLWELCRTAYQMTLRPRMIGGAMLACGYLWALMRRKERAVSAELLAFTRGEQMRRLRRFLKGTAC